MEVFYRFRYSVISGLLCVISVPNRESLCYDATAMSTRRIFCGIFRLKKYFDKMMEAGV